jgi:hypothetical protein
VEFWGNLLHGGYFLCVHIEEKKGL